MKLATTGLILSTTHNIYKIVALPPPNISPNSSTALKDSHIASKAISDLLRTKCVEIMAHQPDIVNTVSILIQPSDKKRLILDFRHVNLYVLKWKF